jgi:hypothetical protein
MSDDGIVFYIMEEQEQKKGHFVISLDFELFWGMFDKVTIPEYGERIQGEQTAIPRMLELFSEYGIHATWATVGMLMARSKDELLSLLPPQNLQPRYQNMDVSSYRYIESMPIGMSEKDDTYHFGSTLVQKILETPHQEIGNHTFSHFYCIDGSKNNETVFAADLNAWNKIGETYGIHTTSIVFPRNQTSPEALHTCYEKGIRAYRGNEDHFLYRARGDEEQSLFIRAFRLLDHYVNISGHHTYRVEKKEKEIINIPASRFLRPFMPKLSFLEPLRLRRIKNGMTYAAKRGEVFHLWWHPHNFGINQEENFKNLEDILIHFKTLQEKYGMQSSSMEEISRPFL